MAETLHLRVITPERLLLDEEVDEVTAPGTIGEFGVLPNHVTFLSSLQPGRLSYKRGGQARLLAVSSGFAEVTDNIMTVLVDKSLRTLSATDPAFAEAQAARQRAQVWIEVAGSIASH